MCYFTWKLELVSHILWVIADSEVVFWIAEFVTDVAAANPNGNEHFLANGVSMFFINGKRVDINGLRKLRNPPSRLLFF